MSPILLNIFTVCLENKVESMLIKKAEDVKQEVAFPWLPINNATKLSKQNRKQHKAIQKLYPLFELSAMP